MTYFQTTVEQHFKSILDVSMSLFLDTILNIPTNHGCKKTRKYKKDKVEFVCYRCKKTFPICDLTLDHVIPRILIFANFKYKMRNRNKNLKPCCGKCNNHDLISSSLGSIFKSRNLSEIKKCSRRLCDLVRKKKRK